MTNDVKLRLYVTAIVIAMAILYVGPLIVTSHLDSVQSEFLANCKKKGVGLEEPGGFIYCLEESHKVALPLWMYLLPYLPAGTILWFNWLIKPSLRLSVESYPKRTMNVLLWFGLFVAAWGIGFPILNVVNTSDADLYKIPAQSYFMAPWVFAAWLSAPLLFHHLIAPVSLAASMKKAKIALLLLAAAPIVAGILIIVRQGLGS